MSYPPSEGPLKGDLSRFAFDTAQPRLRSRNTTPTHEQPLGSNYAPASDYGDYLPNMPHPEERFASYNYENLGDSDVLKDHRQRRGPDIGQSIPLPSSSEPLAQTYPEPQRGPHRSRLQASLPPTPPTDQRSHIPRIEVNSPRSEFMVEGVDGHFPPEINPQVVGIQNEKPRPSKRAWFKDSTRALMTDTRSVNSTRSEFEAQLVKNVMNAPLIGQDDQYSGGIVITANFIIYIFEIVCGITSISLSSVLLSQDPNIPKGIYRYMIADSVVSTIVAILFLTTVINFERRNGSFYCTAAAIMKIVSFILVTSTVIPADCTTTSVCNMRKAVSAFTIISTFLWEGDLVMFLTTLYISRLNLLKEINSDFRDPKINTSRAGEPPKLPQKLILQLKREGNQLDYFYLDPSNQLFRVNSDGSMEDKRVSILYREVNDGIS